MLRTYLGLMLLSASSFIYTSDNTPLETEYLNKTYTTDEILQKWNRIHEGGAKVDCWLARSNTTVTGQPWTTESLSCYLNATLVVMYNQTHGNPTILRGYYEAQLLQAKFKNDNDKKMLVRNKLSEFFNKDAYGKPVITIIDDFEKNGSL